LKSGGGWQQGTQQSQAMKSRTSSQGRLAY
jgi:hypothetical protein